MSFEQGRSYTHNTHGYSVFTSKVEATLDDPEVYHITLALTRLPGPLSQAGVPFMLVGYTFLSTELISGDWTEIA